jgi:hypothetical protein
VHEREIALFVLLPRSLTRKRYEGVRRTHRGKFWELNDRSLDLPPLPGSLQSWEQSDDHHRPHQTLSYLASPSFLPRERPPIYRGRTELEKGVYMFARIMYSRGASENCVRVSCREGLIFGCHL